MRKYNPNHLNFNLIFKLFYICRKVHNYCEYAKRNSENKNLIYEELYMNLKFFLENYVADCMEVNIISD